MHGREFSAKKREVSATTVLSNGIVQILQVIDKPGLGASALRLQGQLVHRRAG
jgi:hypothetical protein